MGVSFRFHALYFLGTAVIAACGASEVRVAPSATAVPTTAALATTQPPAATTQPSVTAAGQAGALRFDLAPGRSKATVRVREQLAELPAPSDAVLATTAVSGQLILLADGAFAPGSSITVDLTSLRSDQSRRDNFIKMNTLETNRFPTARFVPTKAVGLPAPLPTAGEWTFTLTGSLTIHGVEKEVTWDAHAKRDGPALAGDAKLRVRFGDFGMSPPRVLVVLSIVDEIRLEIDVVATAVAS